MFCYVKYTFLQVSSNFRQIEKNQLGILLGDFNEYLKVIPNRFYMTCYIKKRLKVLVGISKPKIVRYDSCVTLNQKVNNIRKSHVT